MKKSSHMWRVVCVMALCGLFPDWHSPVGATPQPTRPDAGLLAAVDSQNKVMYEGIVEGDFEEWYPEVYPGFTWQRTVREIGPGGLFQADYTILHSDRRKPEPIHALSLLLFRPESPSGTGLSGRDDSSDRSPSRMEQARRDARMTLIPTGRAARLLEEALVGARFHEANSLLYAWAGDDQGLSFVSRLPPDFPGMRRFGEPGLHRVTFYLQPRNQEWPDLVVKHAPMLWDAESIQGEPFQAVIGRFVSMFQLRYWDADEARWRENWEDQTSMPRLMQVIVGSGKVKGPSGRPRLLVARVVALSATEVPALLQGNGSVGPPLLPRGTPSFSPLGIQSAPDHLPTKNLDAPAAIARVTRDQSKNASSLPKRRTAHDVELIWMGRSGMEYAKFILSQDALDNTRPYDALQEC